MATYIYIYISLYIYISIYMYIYVCISPHQQYPFFGAYHAFQLFLPNTPTDAYGCPRMPPGWCSFWQVRLHAWRPEASRRISVIV